MEMVNFAQSCKELMKKINLTKKYKTNNIDPYRVGLEAIHEERLARAKDEVEYLIHLSRVIDDMNGNSWQELKERISDLEEGIKILEGAK